MQKSDPAGDTVTCWTQYQLGELANILPKKTFVLNQPNTCVAQRLSYLPPPYVIDLPDDRNGTLCSVKNDT